MDLGKSLDPRTQTRVPGTSKARVCRRMLECRIAEQQKPEQDTFPDPKSGNEVFNVEDARLQSFGNRKLRWLDG